MNRLKKQTCSIAITLLLSSTAGAVTVDSTERLCVLAGPGDTRVSGQTFLDFYGTDLGYSYEHQGKIEFLFGDTWANGFAGQIDGFVPRDDSYANIDLSAFPDGASAEAACANNQGLLKFGTYFTGLIATLNPGVPMELLKTPLGGFSTGSEEYGMFLTAKPVGCAVDNDCDGDFVCDQGLGFSGEEYYDEKGLTFACIDGTFGCLNNTMAWFGFPIPNTGFCVDPGSSVATNDDVGRISSVVVTQKVGVRQSNKRDYDTIDWDTNRFTNATLSTVNNFDKNRADPADNDYTTADGIATANEKVMMWGRPSWTSVNSQNRSLHLYLAYVDMPKTNWFGNFNWQPQYFSGIDAITGKPIFQPNQSLAEPLDLNGGIDDPTEDADFVQQMSMRYLPSINQWVMMYGGGFFTQGFGCLITPCADYNYGDGSIKIRTAPHPWGPWSAPTPVLVGGHPINGAIAGSEFEPGGILRHPSCDDSGVPETCAIHSPGITYTAQEHGFLYAATIIEPWTKVNADNSIDIYWNVSTWDPYYVYLMKTTIKP